MKNETVKIPFIDPATFERTELEFDGIQHEIAKVLNKELENLIYSHDFVAKHNLDHKKNFMTKVIPRNNNNELAFGVTIRDDQNTKKYQVIIRDTTPDK